MNYIQVQIAAKQEVVQEIVIALLADNGFDGFETTNTYINAFIEEDNYSENLVKKLLQPLHISFTATVIEKQNWNELWESNFNPVVIDEFVGIRAHFHTPISNVQHEIIITPKMSFGTGHHATTYTVMQLMQQINFTNKTVFDFGTGTGILAILAEKLGASKILAVDNDDWCIENSLDNITTNHCNNIHIQKADTASTAEKFDIVIANINKNIILDNVDLLNKAAKENGYIILSGLLENDEQDILSISTQYAWQHIQTIAKNNWIAMLFKVKM
ncbi:MAG: 50S ribosomal protein L11 methyltransferase [Chitinophagaceae bacterium]|nr:50S ribosomal protein L11 methyltransferase [Chitinophagaceae bacterium]MCW5904613.1 50S ribosomal protein L11 methyltransferase [Chitinophagaceae bacterium]